MKIVNKILSTQKDYINIVEGYLTDELVEFNSSGKEIDTFIINKLQSTSSYNASNKLYIHEKIIKCLKEIDEFWDSRPEYNSELLNIEGNSITIEAYPNISELLPRYATYFDFIIIRDIPYYDKLFKDSNWTWDLLVNPFKHLLSLLLLKEYIIGENPFIILGSTLVSFNSDDFKNLEQNKKWLLKEITNTVFNTKDRKLINKKELVDLVTPEINFRYGLAPIDQALSDMEKIILERFDNNSIIPSEVIDLYTTKFESKINDIMTFNYYSDKFSTTFGYTPALWSYYDWRKRIIENKFQSKFNLPNNYLISYSFQNEFKWLNNLSIYEIWKIRNEGYFEELKLYFKMVLDKMDHYTLKDFKENAITLNDEFKLFLIEKSNEIRQQQQTISRKANIASISFGATVALSFGSLALPAILPLALLSTLFGITFGKTVIDLIDVKKEKEYSKYLKKTPAAVLIKYLE